MEPNSKAFQALTGAVREATGSARGASLQALQIVDLKATFDASPGAFRNLLQAETQRVEKPQKASSPGPAAGAEGAARASEARSEDAPARGTHTCRSEACGKASPDDGEPSPVAEEARDAQPADAKDAETAAAPADDGEESRAETESAGESARAAGGEEPDPNTGEGGGSPADGVPVAAPQTQEDITTSAATTAAPAVEQVAAATPADPADPDTDTGQTAAGTPEEAAVPAAPAVAAETPATAGEPADPAQLAPVAPVAGGGRDQPAARAREQVAANLQRNPEAEGLRQAGESLEKVAARSATAGESVPAGTARTPAVAAQDPARPGQAVAQELRAADPAGRAVENTPAREAQPASPRPVSGLEMTAQIRMPAASARQVEQALAARAAGEVAESRSTTTTTTGATAPGTAGVTTTTPAGEVARSVLQQARASFTRPGWDLATAQRVAQMAARGVQSAEIQVDPPELGPVKVVIQVNNDQQTSVSFSSPNAGVREALEMTAQRLRDALAEAGLDLADVDVSDQSAQEQGAADEGRDDSAPAGTAAAGTSEQPGDEPVIAATVTVRDSDALVDHYV